MSKLQSDKIVDGQPERERYERFCGSFVNTGNRMQAYRMAFVVDRDKTNQWIWEQVGKLMRDPDVSARIQEMRDEAAAATIVTVQEILQDLHDIATADPNELISVNLDACRFCHGIDHHYQWADENEYLRALAKAIDEQAKTTPDGTGGYGYHPAADPDPTCPACFGRGVNTVMAHDSRKVSPQARKLYAGAKVTAGGGLEIKMHDQMKARELVGKVLGVFKDGIPVVAVQPAKDAAKPTTQDDAQKAYLRLVG